jgi:hypothetical protein
MLDKKDDLPPVHLPEPEGAPKPEHGAQVRLTGVARAAARGAAHSTMLGNMQVKAAIEGGVLDGGASPEHQRLMDPEDGSEKEARIRERGEAAGREPSGEDDEAIAAKTAPEDMRDQLQPDDDDDEEPGKRKRRRKSDAE